MRSLSRIGLISPMKLVDEDRDQDDRDLRPVRREEDEDAADRLAAALLGDRVEVVGRAAAEHAAAAATASLEPPRPMPPVAARVPPRGKPIRPTRPSRSRLR